ncbi:hypothetical protein [Novosphingobium sp. NDB2Meth1]|uniref:hypothetical protein n=1 Tax=Novosphingobium sp. NDB2Meth1 TaxID=1892847 RepID=UPI00093043D1|nr:hypothetical protein [Novosphingobium sp. NDB2Meth1]
MMDEDDGPALCCPDEERIHAVVTREGERTFDVHRHKGLLRGYVIQRERKRLVHWLRNGRLTCATETPHDQKRIAQ